jgi:hypothetical protein
MNAEGFRFDPPLKVGQLLTIVGPLASSDGTRRDRLEFKGLEIQQTKRGTYLITRQS